MIISSLVLALVGSLYVGRAGGYGGPGGMMGPQGMMGQQSYGAPGWRAQGGEVVGSLPEARKAVEQSLQSYGNPDLEVTEVMEFSNNYYAEVRESDTGIGALELLVDKRTGQVYPEPGPNMMWNTKYGMMGARGYGGMMGAGARGMMGPNGRGMMGGSSASSQNVPGNTADEMAVGPEQAKKIADAYLSGVSPGTKAEEPERFYGYYTIDTEKDGNTSGMLSVNGYSGEVWYHSWHGPLVAKQEEE
jgi:hypothetical protein